MIRLLGFIAVLSFTGWVLKSFHVVPIESITILGLILIVFGFVISLLLASSLEKPGPQIIKFGIGLIIVGGIFLLF